MCLATVNFYLNKNSDGTFSGIGYKALPKAAFDKSGRLNTAFQRLKNWTKKWSGAFDNKRYQTIFSDDNKSYPMGFHIFLDKKDATDYIGNGRLARVEFKDVMAFGTNETGYATDAIRRKAPCIIANQMRILEIF